jgi:hypothetical protein
MSKVRTKTKVVELEGITDLISAIVGDSNAEDTGNLDIICDIRKTMHSAAIGFVAKTIMFSRAFSPQSLPDISRTLANNAADTRAQFEDMFRDETFKRDFLLMTPEERVHTKRDHIEKKGHPFNGTMMEVTAKLSEVKFQKYVVPDITAEEKSQFEEKFLSEPRDLFGVNIVAVYRAKTQEPDGINHTLFFTYLSEIYQSGIKFYEATLEPEIPLDRVFDALTSFIDELSAGSRNCKNAINIIKKSKHVLAANIKRYLRDTKITNSPFSFFESFVSDVETQVAGEVKGGIGIATEFAVLLNTIRKTMNSRMGAAKQGNMDKAFGVAEQFIAQITKSRSETDSKERARQEQETLRLKKQLFDLMTEDQP